MSDAVYEWYVATRKLIDKANKDSPDDPGIIELISGWNAALETMEIACPNLKSTYERRKAVQESFTYEQIDHICYMIGDWYVEWKDRIITDLKQGTHRLGYAKEQLKTMICGD